MATSDNGNAVKSYRNNMRSAGIRRYKAVTSRNTNRFGSYVKIAETLNVNTTVHKCKQLHPTDISAGKTAKNRDGAIFDNEGQFRFEFSEKWWIKPRIPSNGA
jgi:hypothetical protein